MTDDRLRRWLEAADRPERPRPEFAAALLDDIGHELGFGGARLDAGQRPGRSAGPRTGRGVASAPEGTMETVSGAGVRLRPRPAGMRSRRLDLLLVAAIIVAAAGGLVLVAGAVHDRLVPPPATSLLDAIRQAGRIRIAIRPDHPQFTVNGQAAAGFDSDVATALAARLGVTVSLVIEPPATMLQPGGEGAWDLALPSIPDWQLDASRFTASAPYYRWPHYLVVPASSPATGIGDLPAGPVCAVAGDAGEAWLRGTYGGVAGSQLTRTITTRTTDVDCLAAIASGAAVAAVTARLSAADVRVRPDIRAIGGPDPEPRGVVVSVASGGLDPASLLDAVDGALAAMRADGTLTRLSQSRFGGDDLTTN